MAVNIETTRTTIRPNEKTHKDIIIPCDLNKTLSEEIQEQNAQMRSERVRLKYVPGIH